MKQLIATGVFCVAMLLAVTGCAVPTLEERLASTDPKERINAVFELAGEPQSDADATVHLIALLADEDEGVRLYASTALRRRTGQRHGFLPSVCPRYRATAIVKWIGWCTETYPSTAGRFEDLKKTLASYVDACVEPETAAEGEPAQED